MLISSHIRLMEFDEPHTMLSRLGLIILTANPIKNRGAGAYLTNCFA
jgi:hypothetical protein